MARLGTATWGALLLALLLLPSGAWAAWEEHHGGPSRNVRAVLPGGPMDVVEVFDTTQAYTFTNSFWGSRVLPTPHGVVLVEDTEEGCSLVVVATPGQLEGTPRGPVARRPVVDCNFGLLIGYDPVRDAVLVCDNSNDAFPVLRFVEVPTGRTLWHIVPSEVLGPPVGAERWFCLGPAIDVESRTFAAGIEVYTGATGSDHLVILGDLDTGDIAWRADLPAQAGLIPFNTGLAPETYPRPIYPRGVTLTTTGVVVTGHLGCAANHLGTNAVCIEEGFVAWLSRDGDFFGMASATGPESVDPTAGDVRSAADRSRAVSQYAVASGPIAVVGLGAEVVVINPEAAAPVLRAPLAGIEPTSRSVYLYAGSWTDSLVLVPLVSSITALDPVTLEPEWSFTDGLEWRIVDTMTTTGGETYVLLADFNGEDAFRLVVVQTSTGEVLRRLPIPGRLHDEDRLGGWNAHMVPLAGEGIAIGDLSGRVIFLGAADPALVPAVELSDPYPAPGEEFSLTVDATSDARVIVTWGDGSEQEVAPGSTVSHLFAERGTRDVAVAAIYPEGTTATRVLAVDVGGSPPQELSALQKAFSPDYQNWTFFVLGTLITVVGLAVTVGRQRRRFNKLERELSAVEEIRMLSVDDPRAAVLALKAYRARLPQDLARRRIDDSQYQVLDIRSARLLKVLRTRLFAPYDAELSVRYHRLLDAAFEDAILQPSERDALLQALAAEPHVTPVARAEMSAILADFTTERAEIWAR